MLDFWKSGTGAPLTGSDGDSFMVSFQVIPNGTTAYAFIKSFLMVVSQNPDIKNHYEIIWKINAGDFKDREVKQKIKAFDQKPETRQRALNMLTRIYGFLNHKPLHSGIPTNEDHRVLHGKILGIKISEWQSLKKDGSGVAEGNYVSEVHKPGSEFVVKTGDKLPPLQASNTYNDYPSHVVNGSQHDNDLPF